MPSHTEHAFETAIEAILTGSDGYETRKPSAYDEALALFPGDVAGFLKDVNSAERSPIFGTIRCPTFGAYRCPSFGT